MKILRLKNDDFGATMILGRPGAEEPVDAWEAAAWCEQSVDIDLLTILSS